jgi:hypothetical protein
MKYKNIIKLRLSEIKLLAVVPTQFKFSIIKDLDEPTMLLFEAIESVIWALFHFWRKLVKNTFVFYAHRRNFPRIEAGQLNTHHLK